MPASATERFLAAATQRGIEVEIHRFPEGTKTSQDAADAVGCELSAIAKSLVFMVDDRPVVAILSGDTRVDPARLARAAGGVKARRASLDEARTATGFAAGGTPAFGYQHPVPVFIDTALRRHRDVWSAAGTPETVYPIALAALVRASGAAWAEVSQGDP